MRGTIVCGVTDSEEGRGALDVAAELSQRLGLRLVLVHVADGVARSAEQRSAVGDLAALLGQTAAEEAADLIVVGSRARPAAARS
jgi:nucleotide-binding universal stress UspA family protein